MKDTLKLALLFVIALCVTIQTVAVMNERDNEVTATSESDFKPEVVRIHKKVWNEFPGMGGSYTYVVTNGASGYDVLHLGYDFSEGEFLQRMQTRGGVQYVPLSY